MNAETSQYKARADDRNFSIIKTLTKQHTWEFLINCQPCFIWFKCAYKDI